MPDAWVLWGLGLYGVGAVSNGFNTWYFGGYRSRWLRRRVGARAMALLSLALFVDSLFGLFFLTQGLRSAPVGSPSWLLARTLLARAIAQEQWELAALCLLMGVAQVAAKLPSDALVGLLEVLEGEAREGR